jgi:hypothetical protein
MIAKPFCGASALATGTSGWSPKFHAGSPMFDPLRAIASALPQSHWPTRTDLNAMLAARSQPVISASGRAVRFVEHESRRSTFEQSYEPRTYLYGEIQFRDSTWHDLFNALVWQLFPRSKAALNGRHYRELKRQRARGARNRGASQDALTLFDEGGLIVAAADPTLVRLLIGAEWKNLFWTHRAQVSRHMRFFIFGHALYEKALDPFVGVTGRTVVVRVSEAWLRGGRERQIAELDMRVAARIADPLEFLSPRQLAPLPVLGVPDWCAENATSSYYDNADYFRPAPLASPQLPLQPPRCRR